MSYKDLEKRKEYMRKYYKTPKYKEYQKKYTSTEKFKIYKRAYQSSEKRRKYKMEYIKNKELTDPCFKLRRRLRGELRQAIKNNQKTGSGVRDLGCTVEQLKFYLEGKFKSGMSWDNWSRLGWHLDHIIPLVCFDVENRKELLKAVHYTNLQPMWAKDNLIKSDNSSHFKLHCNTKK